MIPQLIYLTLLFIGLGMEIARHGEEKKGKYNGWARFLSMLLLLFILYKGGFFLPLIK